MEEAHFGDARDAVDALRPGLEEEVEEEGGEGGLLGVRAWEWAYAGGAERGVEEAVEELQAEVEGEGDVVEVAGEEHAAQLISEVPNVPLEALLLAVDQVYASISYAKWTKDG